LRDLEKFIGECLAAKTGKDIQEIIPDSQDYQNNLEKEMQKRIKDIVEQAKRKGQITPPSQPTPPTKEKEEEI